MSAYQVSPTTVDLMVSAAIEYGLTMQFNGRTIPVNEGNAPAIANMLWIMNAVSVGYRYGDMTVALDECGEYAFHLFRDVTPTAAFGCARCFRYQACESPAWEKSDCAGLVTAIMETALLKGAEKEGSPWGVDTSEQAVEKGFARSTNIVGFLKVAARKPRAA